MVARSAEIVGFSPSEKPRITIAGDGTLAAIVESTRAVILDLPGAGAFAEVGIDPAAGASEITWVGTPPRLLVLSRYPAHSTVHLIDPHGPRTIAEIRLEAPMKLFASVGAHALAVGSVGAAVMTASDTHLTPYQFPARATPTTAGAAAANFVVAVGGSIDEWDPQSRMPKRRLRLPKPAVITWVGGSDRVVWMVTQNDPARIDVLPLVNRGQPKGHDLPEPIASIAGHPRSDLVVCVGADTGKVYVVDLDGRARQRVIAADGIDRAAAAALVIGRAVGVLVAQAQRPIALIPLDGREIEQETQISVPPAFPEQPPVVARRSTLGTEDPDEPPEPPKAESLTTEPPKTDLADPVPTATSLFRPAPLAASVAQRLSWRDELVAWARAIAAGAADRGPPSMPPVDTIVARFELPSQLMPALGLLYGAHLGGERGAAPVDVARVLGRRWEEALGTGQLAQRGLARYVDSRVLLAPSIQRTLDELPVLTGTMVGVPGTVSLLGPCVIVSADGALATLAERHLAFVGGAILAAHDDTDPAELFVEARARGAAPMLRIAAGELVEVGTDPAVLVVADDAIAEQLGVPRLA